MRTRNPTILPALLLLAVTLGCNGGGKDEPGPAPDVLAQLRALPSVASAEEIPVTGTLAGHRFFVLQIVQPVDHRHPAAGTFHQQATLLWRGADRPTVLLLSGYSIRTTPVRSEPAALLEANQIYVEHRFFAGSTPDSVDWSLLDIYQSASDHHRIVQALRPLLPRPWVNTGSSKGGMTAVFHRYHYPDDVAGTIAYVAPISYGTSDPRYAAFLGQVGDAPCRDALAAYQRALLERADEVKPLVEGEFSAYGDTHDLLGMEQVYEFSAVEAPYYFWQYGGATCDEVPPPDATADELFFFLSVVASPTLNFGDTTLTFYAPYFYQSATELGGPAYAIDHLAPLVVTPLRDVPATYPPSGVAKAFDATVMPAVQEWVTTHASRILFVYGENDPWSAGAFEVNPAREQLRFFVAGGNHSANVTRLSDPDHAAAVAAVRAWAGLAPQALAAPPARLREGLDFEHVVERWPGRK